MTSLMKSTFLDIVLLRSHGGPMKAGGAEACTAFKANCVQADEEHDLSAAELSWRSLQPSA